jgi:hypothetical protein
MWPVAIFLMLVVGFYWVAFMFSLWAWFQFIVHLCKCQFIRAAIWFSLGSGMLFWWMSADIDFSAWLHGSAAFVSLGALGTFARFYRRQQRAVEAVPPFEPAPVVLNINIELSTNPHADRRAVHDDLAALASALRGAIGTEQGPRRLPGPTIIN